MKKIIAALLLFTFIIADCNKEDPISPDRPHSPEFNPPAWIIGTWKDNYGVVKYVFSADNVIMVALQSNVSVDFQRGFSGATVTEDINNDDEYKVSAVYPAMNQTYRFVKKTATSLDYYLITADDAHPADTIDQHPITLMKE